LRSKLKDLNLLQCLDVLDLSSQSLSRVDYLDKVKALVWIP
jgi:hypothetical protein